MIRLLLISNSTNANDAYLNHPKEKIKSFLGAKNVNAIFIPYAGVTICYDEYENIVKERFNEIGHNLTSIHHFKDPVEAIKNAEAIVIGGGNTWQLKRILKENKIIKPIRKKVKEGTPYIGWSAGSNVACPTIMTTNDMPIINPKGMKAINLIPFQINPHYLDSNPDGHAGETREMRIEEYIEVNPYVYVVGLREGSMLLIEGDSIRLMGPHSARIFKKGKNPCELSVNDDFSFLLKP